MKQSIQSLTVTLFVLLIIGSALGVYLHRNLANNFSGYNEKLANDYTLSQDGQLNNSATINTVASPSISPGFSDDLRKEIYIFVDISTFNSLSKKINRLASDISSDLGVKVIVEHGKYTSGPLEIRNILKQSYKRKVLAGSILIGSIPTFYETNGLYTDWFYQDLDDDCPISSDGRFSYVGSNLCNSLDSTSKRDVFTGRITPDVSSVDSIKMIERYLDKNHSYRVGHTTFPRKLLVYPSVQILERNKGKSNAKNPLSVNIAVSIDSQSRYTQNDVDIIYDTDYEKQRLDYLTKLKNNRYESAIINIHGSPDGQFPSQLYDASRITSADISKSSPNILYVALLSCSNGAFRSPKYLAGEFLFNGDTLLVTANSQETFIAGFLEDLPIEPIFFQPLSFLNSIAPIGQMFIHDTSHYVTQIFGDPTLRIRGNSAVPTLRVSDSAVDFGIVTDRLRDRVISVKNVSNSDAKILSLPMWGLTVDGKTLFALPDTIKVMPGRDFMGFNILGKTPFDTVTLKPNEKIDISVQFSPAVRNSDNSIVAGNYLTTYYLLTSDPTKPYLDFELKAKQK